MGRKAWEEHTDGIVYPSVRDPEGECAAVLRPPVLSATMQGRHLGYDWDGQHIRHVYELTLLG
ncbi:RES family NAD+ phosphorylase [Halomonas sp. ATBC28]|uniref:RES family NAD+ phosphorylase n=1 Tax=Halomonas sp. ATBC28 TaxID=2545264 RepID=UPI0024B4820B|nr:RES family NAD+ phosphorylase [Halomonas sp. ATBC28]